MKSYVFAYNDFWAHQTFYSLHSALHAQGVALTVLKQSLIQGQHSYSRAALVDQGKSTIKDGYNARQIPDLANAAWTITQLKSIK